MIKKISRKIKQIIGTTEIVNPICDYNIYKENKNSYAGNSLSGSNVLIVTNLLNDCKEIQSILENEQCRYKVLNCMDDQLNVSKIDKTSEVLLGPFEHIINLVIINYHLKQDTLKYAYLENPVSCIYQWLQVESEYFITHTSNATICSAIIFNERQESIEKTSGYIGIESLIKGLGGVMANHNIIENGILVTGDIPFEDILASTMYLSSKHGQIMAGEVLKMSM